jgi:hypothetical protein
MNMMNVTKRPAAMVGCGIGDAAGAAFEFKSARDPKLLKWRGGGLGARGRSFGCHRGVHNTLYWLRRVE